MRLKKVRLEKNREKKTTWHFYNVLQNYSLEFHPNASGSTLEIICFAMIVG